MWSIQDLSFWSKCVKTYCRVFQIDKYCYSNYDRDWLMLGSDPLKHDPKNHSFELSGLQDETTKCFHCGYPRQYHTGESDE